MPLLPLIIRQTLKLYIDFARAISDDPIYAFYIYFIQWTINNCKVIHKFIHVLNLREELYAENFKKTCVLNEVASEPAIQSCDSGQQIPCFDTSQLTIIWMPIIKLNADCRLPH